MIYESCMNDCVLLSSGFCDSSSKCSTCRRTIESFKIPNNIHTYDLIGMCFCLSIPYCLSCSNSATVFQLKRLSTCDCSNGWLWFQTWAMWRRCLKPVLGATRFDHFDNSPLSFPPPVSEVLQVLLCVLHVLDVSGLQVINSSHNVTQSHTSEAQFERALGQSQELQLARVLGLPGLIRLMRVD